MSPEQPTQPEEEQQPRPQPPSVTLGVALSVAIGLPLAGSVALSPGQRLAQLESRLGTDAPHGANVLQRIIALEALYGVTAIGSLLERMAALEAKANEWLL